jgi:flagellar hook-length control protein FliK
VKAAAPQAPQAAQATAKSGAKTAARAKTSPAAAGFDRALVRAVAAKTTAPAEQAASARAAVRLPVPVPAVPEQAAETARTKPSQRLAARSRGRADESPATERTGAEPPRTPSAVGTLAASTMAAAEPSAAGAAVSTGKRAEPRIQVVDLRRKAAGPEAADTARNGPKAPAEKVDGAATPAKPFAERLTVVEPKQGVAAPARATPLERLREMTGSDLVKTAGIVVRDGGGEIRLTLKPESLGSVRIRLNLEDGRIEGRIVVDTPEARRAFEAGIDGLTRALQADGFQTGALQVSVGGGNANDHRQAAGLLGDDIAAARLRAMDGLADGAAIVTGWTGDGLVNVYA